MREGALLIFFISVFLSTRGQNSIGIPQIINFNNTRYQGGAQTWDIKQDKEGRMYFANNEGLITYDGSYWKIYPQPNKTILRSIAIHNNRIYAGGQDEIGYYYPDGQGILQYKSIKDLIPKQYGKFTDVWDTEIVNGSVFFRTWEYIFEYKNDAVRAYKAIVGWEFMKLAGNMLIAQDKKEGLFRYSNHAWQPLPGQNALYNHEVSGMVSIGRDSLLISTLEHGLFMYSNGSIKPKPTRADKSFINSHIYSFDRINENEFVAGTTSEGCLVINSDGDVVQQIARPEGLQNNNVLCVFLDKEKNLWAGLDNGISFIAYNSAIKYIKPAKPNETAGYATRVFDGKLYIATSDGAYVATLSSNTKDLSFSTGDFRFIKNSGGQTWSLDEVNHSLLLGHNRGGFMIHNYEAVQISQDAGVWHYLPLDPVFPSKKMLAGTYYGLITFPYMENRFRDFQLSEGLTESLRFLALDNNNDIWASHPYRGIYKIKLSPDNRTNSYELFTDKDGLPSSSRNFVFRIRNRIVFSTEKGIYEFDAGKKRFIPSPLLYKVFGPADIQYLNEDEDGNIWFCSGKKIGVVKFNEEGNKHTITYFPELTGKILSGFENVYPFNSENNFIASNNGIIHVNLKKYLSETHELNILLTQVKLLSENDSLVFGGHRLSSGPGQLLQFPISHNSFHFEFSAPTYGLQNNIEYSYQLEGYDNKWSAWTTKPEKDYTNLPNGNFTFRVKARDNLGNESDITSYSFEILPAWYKSTPAYIIYTLLVFSGIYFLSRWQKIKFMKQQAAFEEEQKRLRYIHQLEVEKNEKKIIELENEKLINEVIYKNKELADANMHLMERSDALLKVKDELQKLYRKSTDNHDIKNALQLVNDVEKNNTSWEQFALHFDEINNDLLKKLAVRFPKLTNTDLKVCAYLQLNLSSKEIAQLMNMGVRGVEINRYRLRKKLQLETGQNLKDFLNEIQYGKTKTNIVQDN